MCTAKLDLTVQREIQNHPFTYEWYVCHAGATTVDNEEEGYEEEESNTEDTNRTDLI